MVCELRGAEVMGPVGEFWVVDASVSEVLAFSAACVSDLDGASGLAAESNDTLSVKDGCETRRDILTWRNRACHR